MQENFKIRNQRLIRVISLLLLLTVVLSGCAALDSISSFSETSIKAMSDRTLFDDYVNIIERQKALSDESHYATLDSEKKKREEQRMGVLAFQQNILHYMKALGALASNNIVAHDKNIDALSDNLKNAKYQDGTHIFKAEDISAFRSLGKLLTKLSTENYRQRQLKETIRSANSDFQILITALISYTGIYIESLETEKSFTANYYDTIIKTAASNPPQHAAITLVREIRNEKLNTLENKKWEAAKYERILKKIGDSHNYLNDNVDKISSQQILAMIKQYGREIANLYEAKH